MDEVIKKLQNMTCKGIEEWILDNAEEYHFCEDLSGDVFFFYGGKYYFAKLAEVIKIEEISKSDYEEHVKE